MVVLTQILLNEIAASVFDLIDYVTVGTGDAKINLASTDIETPVQIGASNRNKIADEADSSVTDNFFVKKFKLLATEPNSQPVVIGEVGLQDGANETSNLKAGFVITPLTKDVASQWIIRFNGKVIESSPTDACGN